MLVVAVWCKQEKLQTLESLPDNMKRKERKIESISLQGKNSKPMGIEEFFIIWISNFTAVYKKWYKFMSLCS